MILSLMMYPSIREDKHNTAGVKSLQKSYITRNVLCLLPLSISTHGKHCNETLHIMNKWLQLLPLIIFLFMTPKIFRTYPHREEDQEIAMASVFLRLILLKVLSNQLKIFVKLT